jgi:hypothetical protein
MKAKINPQPKSDKMTTAHKITFIALCAALAAALTTRAPAQLGYGREPVIVAQRDTGGQYQGNLLLLGATSEGPHQAITYLSTSTDWYYGGYESVGVGGLKSRDRGLSWTSEGIWGDGSNYGNAWVSHYGTYLADGSIAIGFSASPKAHAGIKFFHDGPTPGDAAYGEGRLLHADFENHAALFATQRGRGGNGFRMNFLPSPGGLLSTYFVARDIPVIERVRCQLNGDKWLCAFVGDKAGSGNTDVYFMHHDVNVPSSPAAKRIDGDNSGVGKVREGSLGFLESNGKLLVYFREINRVQSGATAGLVLTSGDGGDTWTETLVTDPSNGDAIAFEVAMDGDRAVASWLRLPQGFGVAKLMYAVSTDGGRSFSPPAEVPSDPPIGRHERVVPHVFLEGGRAVIAYFSLAFSTGNQWQAAYVYSNDGGATFNDPVLLRDEAWPSNSTLDWMYGDGSLNAVIRAKDTVNDFANIWVAGVRFPFIQATQPQAGVIKLEMAGVDMSQSSTPVARWVASTQRGISQHPDHAERWLDLAQSSLLRHSLHNSSRYSRAVDPDGTAARLTQIPLSFTGTVYIQGWVDHGGVNGGSSTSDVFELSL